MTWSGVEPEAESSWLGTECTTIEPYATQYTCITEVKKVAILPVNWCLCILNVTGGW